MLDKLRHAYISDRNYLALYLHAFFKACAMSSVLAFTGSWMYSLGLPLYGILLFYAFDFAIMGLFSPVGLVYVLRFGFFRTLATSNALLVIAMLLIAAVEIHVAFIVPAVFLRGLAFGLIHPAADVIQAIYIEDHHRGRVYTMTFVLVSLASMLSIALTGLLIEYFSYLGLAVFCAVIFVCDSLSMTLLDERIRGSTQVRLGDIYKQPFTKDFRPYFTAFAGEQFFILGFVVFVPLLLYIGVGDFRFMAGVIVISVFIELVVLLLFGHWIDRAKKGALIPVAGILNAGALLFYAFGARTPFMLVIADSWMRSSQHIFTSAFRGSVHSYIRKAKSSLIVYGTGWQMSLCFWEFICLSGFAGLAYLYGSSVLPWLTGICAAGMFIALWKGRDLARHS